MTDKEKMIALLNYCFDNNVEPWNNQENIKTVESFINRTRGLASNTGIIGSVSGICKGDYLQKDNSCKKWGGECSKKHCDYYR